MKSESGRSLIEMIGVMAIGAVMVAGAYSMYSTIRHNQIRQMASAQLEQIASDTKLLMEMRGDYTGLSIEYLIKAGAMVSDKAPIGGAWSVAPYGDGTSFEIKLMGLSRGECEYFATKSTPWATTISVNGVESAPDEQCFNSQTNIVSFIVQ